MCNLSHKYSKIIVGSEFLLMYAGLTLLLLPMVISAWPLYLILSDTPQTYGFEDDLRSVDSILGTPTVTSSPVASGIKAIKCQNGDYVLWELDTPSKTIDLTFKIYWIELPTIANESLNIGEIWDLYGEEWQCIFCSSLYCTPNGYRGWNLWTSIPGGRGSFVSSDIVYALETNRWYTIRMTADLKTGTFRMYLDRIELASITDVAIPPDVYIDFFRLGSSGQSDRNLTIYYDDVTVSLLDLSPPQNQWSIRITSSSGGSTTPYGTTITKQSEGLTVNATQATGYVFRRWILDGVDYGTNLTVTVPAQSTGTQHTLHAEFTNTNPPSSEQNLFPLQVTGSIMTIGSGYVLWKQKKRESAHSRETAVHAR